MYKWGLATVLAVVAIVFYSAISFAQVGLDNAELNVLYAINSYRAEFGLQPLVASPALTRPADYHSAWMANHNCFAHQCSGEPGFGSRLALFGYSMRSGAGENIAAGFQDGFDTFRQWVNSPPHNQNILDPRWRSVGISRVIKPNSTYRYYWTMDLSDRVDGNLFNANALGLSSTVNSLSQLRVRVFDLSGKVLFESDLAGAHALQWALTKQRRLANGVYLYVVSGRRADGSAWRSQVQKLAIGN